MRIGYSWSTVTGDPCPTCNQNVVTKNKRLWLFGIPLGIMAGCFPIFRAFLAPITVFGRNVPVAALIPLTPPGRWSRHG